MSTSTSTIPLRSESAVKQRYAAAAKTPEAALCCPVEYNPDHLKIIPPEVIEKDYGSIDGVVSNCVLNLVEPKSRRQLFAEIFRVLKKGGRAMISDIVSDKEVPEHLQTDPELWSGCISGALTEERFLKAFADAGIPAILLLHLKYADFSLLVPAARGREEILIQFGRVI